ncbi:hypothetical protein KSP40_PGU000751 [Platanthera guangdongensis]|uniref:IST1-like protein n=1 Tax=Platanthera guangdongensis TaxID=2320717 RepID=A0ABR2LK34_9ASPA
MLSKSFKSGKCKTSLKLAASRIKLLKNKRDIQVRHLRRELAQLLATGQEQTARIRVEHVIREEKTMSGYDLIEIYCELIVARLPIIDSQKGCPIDLKEAISSVIFASPRCADLPELVDVRKHFTAKYGKDFITSALELRPDCGVNRMIVEKLSAKAPNTETKIKILTEIAKEHDVKWDPKAVEEELQNPKDLLNGSSSFMRANEIIMEPLNVDFSPVDSQKEADSKIHQNEIPTKPTSFNSSSPANLRTSTFTVPPTRNESLTSDRTSGVSEVRDSYSQTETVSSNEPTWTTEFKDAISAAQVAAESAERASIAARAAAELATRGNISRQSSNDPNRPSIYSSRDTLPNIVPSSKLKDVRNESVKMDDNLDKDFQGVKDDVDKLPRDKLREGFSHFTANDMNVYSQINNGEKFDGIRGSFSRIESIGSKKELVEEDFIEDVEVNYDGTFFASSIGPPDDDTIWVPAIGKQQTSNTLEINDHKPHTSSDYASPVFDEYGPEPNEFKNYFLDSFDNKKNDQNVFSMSPTNIFSDSLHESHAAALEEVSSAKFHDNNTVTYDDSDGTSEDEDVLSSSLKNGTVQNSSLLHEGGSSQESGPRVELQPSSSSKARPLMGSEENDHLQLPSSGSELDSGSELGLKFGRLTGGLKNRGYNYPPPYTSSSVVHSSLPSKEIADSAISGAGQPISGREKTYASLVIPDEDRYDQKSSWNASTSADSGKAEGSQLEEYTEASRSSKTLARDNSVDDTSRFGGKEFFPNQQYSKQYRGGNFVASNVSEALIEKIDDEKPRTKAYKELSSRMLRTDFDLEGDGEKRNSDISMESRGNSSASSQIKLSRRTRDFTTKGRSNPKSMEYSDIPNSKPEVPPLSRAVDQAKILQGNLNLKPPKQYSSAEQRVHEDSAHKINTKNTEGKPNSVTTLENSGNNNTLGSAGGTILQGTESPKAPHVHPKLPDYDTLAAHFQSLRSNRR